MLPTNRLEMGPVFFFFLLTGCTSRLVVYYQERRILTNHSAQQTRPWQSSAIRLQCKDS